MMDTLKFATRLRSAGFSQEQAEAVADAWAEQARDNLPTRLDLIELDNKLDRRITQFEGRVDTRFAQLEGKVDKLAWMLGFTLAGIVAILIRLLFVGA